MTLADCSTTAEVENELARIDADNSPDGWQLDSDDLSEYQRAMVERLLSE